MGAGEDRCADRVGLRSSVAPTAWALRLVWLSCALRAKAAGARLPQTLGAVSDNLTRSTAVGYWHFASQYLHAADTLRNSPSRQSAVPVLQLYGQAIELVLKAFLLKRGLLHQELRKLSHSLVGLVSTARRRKLGIEAPLSRRDIALIQQLDQVYATHRLRYIVVGHTDLPTLESVADLSSRLVEGLAALCTSPAPVGANGA